MLNLEKLDHQIDKALNAETDSSLSLWLAGKRNLKAYGIYGGCIYEGGGVDGDLYLDKEKARLFLIQEVDKENDDRLPKFKYKKVSEDRYLAGSDVLTIQEFTIHK